MDTPPNLGAAGPSRKTRRPLAAGLVVVVLFAGAALAVVSERRGSVDLDELLTKLEARLEASHRKHEILRLREQCHGRDCSCARLAASLGLDSDANAEVLEVVAAASECRPRSDFDGYAAEALVRRGDEDEGDSRARSVLATSAKNPNALYARALAVHREGDDERALELAEASKEAGRGAAAGLLIGLIAYRSGDFARARTEFNEIATADPKNVDALFNLGSVAQRQGRYGEARSSFIKVTRLVPKHQDARYNLALLAHSVGASDEARHHVRKFKELKPEPERIEALEAALEKAPANLPAFVMSLGDAKTAAKEAP